jgi:hypothetical protein
VSEEPEAMRMVAAKRRIIELAVNYAGRLHVTCRDGVDLVEKWFQKQKVTVKASQKSSFV